jgi:uncharacterized membrane protein
MQLSEKKIHLIFVLSVLLKALNGVLEIILGVAFLFTSTLAGLVQTLVQGELIEDPADIVANSIQHFLPFLTHSQYFISFYLLSHGVIKIFLVVGLLRNKVWAYPAAIIVFALFIIYQLYRYSFTHSIWLILLTIFDLFVIWLTWHEYRLLKNRKEGVT